MIAAAVAYVQGSLNVLGCCLCVAFDKDVNDQLEDAKEAKAKGTTLWQAVNLLLLCPR